MENLSKALLIAAGVLIGIIVLTMLVVMHRNVTSYYTAKEKAGSSEPAFLLEYSIKIRFS